MEAWYAVIMAKTTYTVTIADIDGSEMEDLIKAIDMACGGRTMEHLEISICKP